MKLRNIIKKYKKYNIFFVIFIIFIIMLGLCIYLSLTGSKSLIEGNTNEEKDQCKPRICEDNLTKYTKCVDVYNIDEISRGLWMNQSGEVVYHCPKKNVEPMTCNVENDTDKDHNGLVISICAPKFSTFNSIYGSSMTQEEEDNIESIQQDITKSNWKEATPKFETPNLLGGFFS
tara:strand:- start:1025 stop:1549 length:525 start_codon:yes stop_codon:yes gene_type:complete